MEKLVTSEIISNSRVLKLQIPRVDMMLARRFRDELREYLKEEPRRIVLDLELVTHFDSSGMGALKAFMEDTKTAGGTLILCNLNRSMQMLLKLSRLESLFEVADSLEKSLE